MELQAHLSLTAARERLADVPEDWIELFRRDGVWVEFYVPAGVDAQTPHDRDEFYFVASGSGSFVCNGKRTSFGPSDFLFVAARAEHRFEDFSDDFAAWVVFFGPPR
ncbi:MAG TPA: cupin domain-containing protein [Candidatus Acidoferrales bacterium]|nr:cupin domain-containing protein [Candidatus Acidoferrales bacterium]